MSDASATPGKDHPPQVRDSTIKKVAIVQCEGFRCLAYRDAETWRDLHTGRELPEVKGIISEIPV
jgi:hypothetical protein